MLTDTYLGFRYSKNLLIKSLIVVVLILSSCGVDTTNTSIVEVNIKTSIPRGAITLDPAIISLPSLPLAKFKASNPVYSYGISQNMKGSSSLLRYVSNANNTTPTLVSIDSSNKQLHFWSLDPNTKKIYQRIAQTQTPVANFDSPWSIMSADFNKDGINDIVVQVLHGAYIFTMDTQGFVKTSKFISSINGDPNFIIPADYDSDGDIDLIAISKNPIVNATLAMGGGYYSHVIFLTNDGTGNFPNNLQWHLTVSEKTTALKQTYITGRPVLKDLDNDGDLDLLVATFSIKNPPATPAFVVENIGGWFNQNSGVVVNGLNINLAASLHPSGAVIVDYNKDGLQDIIIANYKGSNVNIFYGNGTVAGFSASVAEKIIGGFANNDLVVHDMNNDALLDIIVANADPINPTIEIFYHGALTSETLPASIHINPVSSTQSPYFDTRYNPDTYPIDLRVFDWDGNGLPDIITANYNQNGTNETSSFSVVLQVP